jgi:hypothetical protein
MEDSEDLTATFMRRKRSFPNRFAKIFGSSSSVHDAFETICWWLVRKSHENSHFR